MDVLGTLIYIIYLTKLEVCTSISIVDYIFEIKQNKREKNWNESHVLQCYLPKN